MSDGEEIRLQAAPEVLDYLWSADDRVLTLLRADTVERLAMPGGHSLGFTSIAFRQRDTAGDKL